MPIMYTVSIEWVRAYVFVLHVCNVIIFNNVDITLPYVYYLQQTITGRPRVAIDHNSKYHSYSTFTPVCARHGQ